MRAALLLALALAACAAAPEAPATPAATATPGPPPTVSPKIALDLSNLNTGGLYGPPDGLRAMAYEFCLPVDSEAETEVKAIDPTVQFMHGSRGRIGCTARQVLAIGSTHQPNYREVLAKLAALPYIKRIQQTNFE